MSQYPRLSDYLRFYVSPVGKAILAMAASMRVVDLVNLAKSIDLPTTELHHILVGSAPPLTVRQRRALEGFLGGAAASLVLPPPGRPGPMAVKAARITGQRTPSVPARTAAPAVASARRLNTSSRTTTRAVVIPSSAPSQVRRVAAPAPNAATRRSSVAAQLARLAALSLQVQTLQQEMASIITDLTHRDLG